MVHGNGEDDKFENEKYKRRCKMTLISSEICMILSIVLFHVSRCSKNYIKTQWRAVPTMS
jgi:hypothetical protein